MLAFDAAFTTSDLIEPAFRLREFGEDLSQAKPSCRVS
jgi:hypothetical protein